MKVWSTSCLKAKLLKTSAGLYKGDKSLLYGERKKIGSVFIKMSTNS